MKINENHLTRVTDINEIKIGRTFTVGYRGMKKQKVEIIRLQDEQDRKDYKRFWVWAVKEGVVYTEKTVKA